MPLARRGTGRRTTATKSSVATAHASKGAREVTPRDLVKGVPSSAALTPSFARSTRRSGSEGGRENQRGVEACALPRDLAGSGAMGMDGRDFRAVVMISREGCVHCRRAKDALDKRGVEVEVLSLSAAGKKPLSGSGRDDLFRAVQEISGKSSVPQIFLVQRPGDVLGADDLISELEDGRLDAASLMGTSSSDPLPADLRRAFDAMAEGVRSLTPASTSSDAAAAAGRFADIILVDSTIQKFGLEYSQLFGLAVELGDGAVLLEGKTSSIMSFTRSLLHRGQSSAVFSSRQLVQWLIRTGHAPGEEAAIRLGQRMLSYNFIAPPSTYGAALRGGNGGDEQGGATAAAASPAVSRTSSLERGSISRSAREEFSGQSDKLFVTFREYAKSRATVMNLGFPWPGVGTSHRDANVVATELRERLEALYESYLSDDGRQVDYAGLKESIAFRALVDATCELQTCDLGGMTCAQLLAFFINVYNILIVHATTVLGTPENMLKRLRFFDTVGYDIGGVVYSANDIEHGVLRANAPSPAALASLAGYPGMAPKTFKASDARCRFARTIGVVDPRIHFTLVCGAKSCPPIRVFDADNLELGLESATEAFVEGDVGLDEVGGSGAGLGELTVTMSKLFQWYAGDFGSSKEDILRFVQNHLRGGKKALLGRYIESGPSNIKVAYKTYDWSVNGLQVNAERET